MLSYALKITTVSIKKNNLNLIVNEALALSSLNGIYENQHLVRYFHSWYENDRLHLIVSLNLSRWNYVREAFEIWLFRTNANLQN